MNFLRTFRTRGGSAALAMLTVVAMVFVPAQPAQASITDSVKRAYGAYVMYVQGQIVLVGATQMIIGAINQAKVEIMAHIDLVAAADIRACARAAVIDVEDIPQMSPDTVQAFARDATNCVTRAEALIRTPGTNVAVVDQLGFTINAVGPIALLARVHGRLSTPGLRSSLVDANNAILPILRPSCTATPLRGDQPPGSLLEWLIRCRAYNGDTGIDSQIGSADFTRASRQALRNTSHPVAVEALAELT